MKALVQIANKKLLDSKKLLDTDSDNFQVTQQTVFEKYCVPFITRSDDFMLNVAVWSSGITRSVRKHLFLIVPATKRPQSIIPTPTI